MNGAGDTVAGLTAGEKRELLVKLLKSKTRNTLSRSSAPRNGQSFLDEFAVPVSDLESEAVLDPAIQPEGIPVEPGDEPARIFLTGATGFLGAFLLYELLQQTAADIYCLVRCSDPDQGKQRILRNLDAYFLETDPHNASRVIPVMGDLSQPLLGLSERDFQTLAGMIDSIYHSGAWVNWIYPYEKLKATNVLGTEEVLRLAAWVRAKPVHFISSLSVFPLVGVSETGVIQEGDTLDHDGILYGGYPQSKWVAEKLATVARSRGLPVVIYRPGLITGHSQTGAWNTDDFTCRLIKSWIELGSAPVLDSTTDMTPVDYVSQAIVYLSKREHSLDKAFHLANPPAIPLRKLTKWVQSFGYSVQSVPYERWRTELIDRGGRFRTSSFCSLVPLFSVSVSEKVPTLIGRLPRFECQSTLGELAGTSIACPPVDGRLLDTYFSYFIRTGFLRAPSTD